MFQMKLFPNLYLAKFLAISIKTFFRITVEKHCNYIPIKLFKLSRNFTSLPVPYKIVLDILL